jgi:hypothetical protein
MKTWISTISACLMLCAGALALPAAAIEKISSVDITRSGFLLNRSTNTFDTSVTIKNTGAYPLVAPLRIAVEAVAPKSVSLYNIYGKTLDGKPYVEVALPNFQLAPQASVSVPVRFVNLGKSVTSADFAVFANELKHDNSRSVQVRAKFNAENGGESVGEGFAIKADNVVVGKTDASGQAVIKVVTSTEVISVSQPPNYIGSAVLIPGSGAENVEIEVGDSGELSAGSTMRVDRLHHLMLPNDTQQIAIRFFDAEKPVQTDLIEVVEYRDPSGADVVDITNLFAQKPDGAITAVPAQFFAKLGGIDGKKIIFAQVLDKNGVSHFAEVPFYISRFKVVGQLVAPPSNPTLNVAGVPLTISILNTDIEFETESAADGTFPLPNLPAGNVAIKAQTMSDDISFIAQGVAVLTRNTQLKVTLRGPSDIAANVPVINSTPL